MDDSEVALPSAVSQPLPTTIFENIDDKLKEKVAVDEVSQIGKPEEQAASGGRKRALLVAFNYEARKEEGVPLLGTHRDAERVGRLLQDRFGYAKQDIIFIFDKGSYPNRGELLHKLKDFVSEARAGDQLFFYFAGHGDQVQSFTGTETDGFNERLLLPADPVGESAGSDVGSKEHSSDDKSIKLRREILDHRISKAGVTDNNLNKILVGNLPSGCRLTALIDACNSGTMLDLPHHHCNRLMIPDSKDDLHRSECRACAEKKAPGPSRQSTWHSIDLRDKSDKNPHPQPHSGESSTAGPSVHIRSPLAPAITETEAPRNSSPSPTGSPPHSRSSSPPRSHSPLSHSAPDQVSIPAQLIADQPAATVPKPPSVRLTPAPAVLEPEPPEEATGCLSILLRPFLRLGRVFSFRQSTTSEHSDEVVSPPNVEPPREPPVSPPDAEPAMPLPSSPHIVDARAPALSPVIEEGSNDTPEPSNATPLPLHEPLPIVNQMMHQSVTNLRLPKSGPQRQESGSSLEYIMLKGKIPPYRHAASPEPHLDEAEEAQERPDVVSWSACSDGKRAFGSPRVGGFMTDAFCSTFVNVEKEITFKEAFTEINRKMRNKGLEMQQKYPDNDDRDEWGSLQAQLGSLKFLTHSDHVHC